MGRFDQHSAEQRRRAAISAATRVLQKCSAIDPTVLKPNDATVLAWAELIAEAGLEDDTDRLLEAVTCVYSTVHSDAFRLLPTHVITAARELRQEAAMREPTARLEARQDARDKALAAAEDADEQAAAADGMVPIRDVSPFIVACLHPPCSAPVGKPCTAPARGRERERALSYSRAHPNRIARAVAERALSSPQAHQAAEEAVRQEQMRALARYDEHNPRQVDVMDAAERANLYRLAGRLAERPEGEAP
ncbi:hypothetical protein MMARJ_17410 [Mycobacterium marseillense]|uniref:DUF222 domain-containing protein n=1 Tax=Mycobacterium marseillense TaxID=701042 RepID=A0ABN5ZQX1_9MYCO|nr:hypothetical protein MMARJ_17410 [Mycobacterium marseillense]